MLGLPKRHMKRRKFLSVAGIAAGMAGVALSGLPTAVASHGPHVRRAKHFATSGSGTNLDPWKGWEAVFDNMPANAAIVFDPGVFEFPSPPAYSEKKITRGDVHVYGYGEQSIIRATNYGNGLFFEGTNDKEEASHLKRIEIRGIHLVGADKDWVQGGGFQHQLGIHLKNVDDFILDNIHVEKFGNSRGATVAVDEEGTGIEIDDYCINGRISNILAETCKVNGLSITGNSGGIATRVSRGHVLSNIIARRNHLTGVHFIHKVQGVVASSIVCEENEGRGFFYEVSGVTDPNISPQLNVVTGLIAKRNNGNSEQGGHGVNIIGGQSLLIDGLISYDNIGPSNASDQGTGIKIQTGAGSSAKIVKKVEIRSFKCLNNSGSGVYIVAGSSATDPDSEDITLTDGDCRNNGILPDGSLNTVGCYGIEVAGLAENHPRLRISNIRGSANKDGMIKLPLGLTDVLTRDIEGFNPIGKITNPFGTSTVGIGGTGAVPAASTEYTAVGSDCYIVSTGGTEVSISIMDRVGNVIESGLPTLSRIVPWGYKISWGAFSAAPTVTVAGL